MDIPDLMRPASDGFAADQACCTVGLDPPEDGAALLGAASVVSLQIQVIDNEMVKRVVANHFSGGKLAVN